MNTTGSKYEGDLVNAKPEGKGVYQYENGNYYEGEFKRGMFHGEGTMYFIGKGYYKGIWEKGIFISGEYFFEDGLKHSKENWKYCSSKDRRYHSEHLNGIKPAGISNIRPYVRFLQPGMFDCVDGYYDPSTNEVRDYSKDKLLRIPSEKEQNEIMEKAYRCHS